MSNDKKNNYKKGKLEQLITEILVPMSDIAIMKDRVGRTSVFKEGVKFGMIQNETFYLFNESGEYKKVKSEVLQDADKFLQEATKSFWHACGKMKPSKHS